MTDITLEQRAATVPPTTAVTFVPAFSEAARMLGFAQATGSEDGAAYWGAIVAEYEAAAKAALRLPAGEGWQPIETAPKDELILVGPTKRMGICVAMHHSRDGWVTETTGDWSGIYTPTHWQPLPAAPRHETGEFKPCQCHTPRDKELCLHKRECSVVTAQQDKSP